VIIPVCRPFHVFFIGFFLTGITGCAGISGPGRENSAALFTARQQFASGRYRESLDSCRTIIDARPGSENFDQALYCAALSSMQLHPGQAGRAEAAGYFRRLTAECPASPYRPEAELWLAALSDLADHGNAPDPDSLKKKDQEIKRLRGEVQRLNRELDSLKDVDLQLNRQKKDLDNGPD
jgi:hypothetical protein